MPTAEKRAWGRRVMDELRTKLGSLEGLTFEIHAGEDYFGYGLRDALLEARAVVEIPTEHLKQGEQLSFYSRGGHASSTGVERPVCQDW